MCQDSDEHSNASEFMGEVEPVPALVWQCRRCEAINYVLMEPTELTEDEAEAAFRQIHQLDEWEELPDGWRSFQACEIKRRVTCHKCEAWYELVLPESEYLSDDEDEELLDGEEEIGLSSDYFPDLDAELDGMEDFDDEPPTPRY